MALSFKDKETDRRPRAVAALTEELRQFAVAHDHAEIGSDLASLADGGKLQSAKLEPVDKLVPLDRQELSSKLPANHCDVGVNSLTLRV